MPECKKASKGWKCTRDAATSKWEYDHAQLSRCLGGNNL